MDDVRILTVVPLYNHAATVGALVAGIFAEAPSDAHALVVDDGSTDGVAAALDDARHVFGERLHVLAHEKNRGKGRAILSAAAWASENGYTHIITIDADGQHDPAELGLFRAAIFARPYEIIVGERDFNVPNVPGSSRFGRWFSGFWMRVQTGKRGGDMQSGYRAYPVGALLALALYENRYAFEIEVLVKAAWAGIPLSSLPVSVYYPPPAERVSHFRKLGDNIRITLLNTRLTIRALIPLPFLEREQDGNAISVLSPLTSLKKLLARDSTPWVLARSTAMAILICALPLIGFQSIVLLLCIGAFGLNRLWTLAVSHMCWPPLVPALCVEGGYYLRHGSFLTEISLRTLGYEAFQRLWEWLLGALVFGSLAAFLLGAVVYVVAWGLRKRLAGAAS